MTPKPSPKTRTVKAWAVTDADGKIMGRWSRVAGRMDVCVMAAFRYRKLAALTLKHASNGSEYEIRRVEIREIPSKRKRKP